MAFSRTLILSCLPILAACGGAEESAGTPGDTPVIVGRSQQAETFGNATFILTDPKGISYRLGVTIPGLGQLQYDNFQNAIGAVLPAGFTAFRADDGPGNPSMGRSVRGITPSGEGLAIAVIDVDAGYGVNSLSYFLERYGATELPGGGVLVYEGDYMAVYRYADDFTPAGHLLGEVTLTVDVGENRVSGTIFNRRNTGVATLADLTLEEGTLDEGAFSGTTVGGYFDGGGTSTLPGSYTGLIVGPTGQEVIGGVQVTHRASSADRFDEVGVFTGVQD